MTMLNHNNQDGICVGIFALIDANKLWKGTKVYLKKSLPIGENIIIQNVVYADLNENILGMNIIKQANWHISFVDSIIEVFPLDSSMLIPEDAICFKYQRGRRPMTYLNINGRKVKNVLLDTGSDSDLKLCEKDAFCVLGNIVSAKTDTVVVITPQSQKLYVQNVYEEVKINGSIYENVKVTRFNKNLVGLGFMRRFDHLFWDSKHKKVYLWND